MPSPKFIPIAFAAAGLAAQGPFVNYEIPVSKGITVASFGSVTRVIACNPDDNSISVINPDTLVAERVAVGLGPVSVFYDAGSTLVYTANWLGDSVSVVDLATSGGPRLVRTVRVGDEPIDLSVRPGTNELYVLLGAISQIAAVDKISLTPVNLAGFPTSYEVIRQFTTVNRVMKMPWRIVHAGNGGAFVLNQRGGSKSPQSRDNFPFEFDIANWSHSGLPTAFPTTVPPLNGLLGTTNLGMARSTGGRVFVVGNVARNDKVGEPVLRTMVASTSADTGFVESHLFEFNPATGTATDRDLNRTHTGTVIALNQRVSMPTDVAIFEQSGAVSRLYVPSFSTDRLVEVLVTTSPPAQWRTQTTALAPRSSYTLAGPRSVVVVPGATPRVFVYCRLDATVRRFNITTSNTSTPPVASGTVNLQDPQPVSGRLGQALLYNAKRSGNNTTSCASCHPDGRTDGLAWRLDAEVPGIIGPVPTSLRDGIASGVTDYPANRGMMVTQSLQGLRTHPSESRAEDVDPMLTTGPFYWRGRRLVFEDFLEAFDLLLGSTRPTKAEMQSFRDYVFTIMYPPNPEQAITRTYDGTQLNGLRQYHEHAIVPTGGHLGGSACQGRSCVECHMLPAGTNRRVTLSSAIGAPLAPHVLPLQNPIKTPQIRGMRLRESEYHLQGLAPVYGPGTDALTASHGLFHAGEVRSTNFLINVVFPQLPPNTQNDADTREFLRAFDTGTAPFVGWVVSLTSANLASTGPAFAVIRTIGEVQADRGDVGVSIFRRLGGVAQGLYYAPQLPGVTYVDANNPTINVASGNLVPPTMTGDDLVVVQIVPVGSERRISSVNGIAPAPVSPTPVTAITDVSLVVPDPWKPVTGFSLNLLGTGFSSVLPTPVSLTAFENFRAALAAAPGTGVPTPVRHEAPRRIRVTGTGIAVGAKLHLSFPTAWNTAVTPPVVTQSRTLILDLHPIRLANGTVVFETSAALDVMVYYALMCGWMAAPGVSSNFNTGVPAAPLNPTAYNRVVVAVQNPGTAVAASPQFVTALDVQ